MKHFKAVLAVFLVLFVAGCSQLHAGWDELGTANTVEDVKNALGTADDNIFRTKTVNDNSALHIIVGKNNPELIHAYFDHARNLQVVPFKNSLNGDKKTPLHVAIDQKSPIVVDALLANGCDPNKWSGGKNVGRPFTYAMRKHKDNLDCLKAFLKPQYILNINMRLLKKYVPNIKHAFKSNNQKPNDYLDYYLNGLGAAVRTNKTSHADNFLSIDEVKKVALTFAIEHDSSEVIDYIVQSDAHKGLINTKFEQNKTALHLAAEQGKLRAAKALIKAGLSIIELDQVGLTPYEYAFNNNHNNIVVYFRRKFMMLLMGKISKNESIIDLIDQSEELKNHLLTFRSPAGQSILHVAARNNNPTAVDELIKIGLDVNEKDNRGQTPLHLAAAGGYQDAVNALLAKGALLLTPDKDGNMPYKLAQLNGHEKVLEALEQAQMAKLKKAMGPQTSEAALQAAKERALKVHAQKEVDAVENMLKKMEEEFQTEEAVNKFLEEERKKAQDKAEVKELTGLLDKYEKAFRVQQKLNAFIKENKQKEELKEIAALMEQHEKEFQRQQIDTFLSYEREKARIKQEQMATDYQAMANREEELHKGINELLAHGKEEAKKKQGAQETLGQIERYNRVFQVQKKLNKFIEKEKEKEEAQATLDRIARYESAFQVQQKLNKQLAAEKVRKKLDLFVKEEASKDAAKKISDRIVREQKEQEDAFKKFEEQLEENREHDALVAMLDGYEQELREQQVGKFISEVKKDAEEKDDDAKKTLDLIDKYEKAFQTQQKLNRFLAAKKKQKELNIDIAQVKAAEAAATINASLKKAREDEEMKQFEGKLKKYEDNFKAILKVEEVEKILKQAEAEFQNIDVPLKMLKDAILSKNLDTVKKALENDKVTNTQLSYGDYPLHLAVRMESGEIFEALLGAGADINAKGRGGNTVLHIAVQDKLDDMVGAIFNKNDVDARIKNDNGDTALHIAVERGLNEIVIAIIEDSKQANELVLEKNKHGEIPLHIAAFNENLAIVQKLLTIQPEDQILQKDAKNLTPVHIAAQMANIQLIDAIKDVVSKQAILKYNSGTEDDPNTPFFQAVATGNIPFVVQMIERGATVENQEDWVKLLKLANATSQNMGDFIKDSIKLNDFLSYLNKNKDAAQGVMIRLLASNPGLVDLRYGPDNRTILHDVAKAGFEEVVKAILEIDEDAAYKQDNSQKTPSDIAQEAVKQLLKGFADYQLPDIEVTDIDLDDSTDDDEPEDDGDLKDLRNPLEQLQIKLKALSGELTTLTTEQVS